MNFNERLHAVWANNDLRNYFFRRQSIKALEELIEYSNEDEFEILDKVDIYCIDNDFDSEDLDNMLYHENLQILAEEFGIQVSHEDDDWYNQYNYFRE